ncbi:MAG TPA: type II toxin-antitoxin system VapC family toxin [Saprospiraceae bacterium]|nr:type II toxin-antitoxin system VapC family toxin [Saprospiraceae bacterium]
MQKIYLDTSVINFLFADDSPEHQMETIDFFERFIARNVYQSLVSVFVLDEIQQTPSEIKKDKLLQVISDFNLELLEATNPRIVLLASAYLQAGAIPPKKIYDALHVAVCVVHKIDYLVSWNYKHLANVNRENRINIVNLAQGYSNQIRIITPLELMSDEE